MKTSAWLEAVLLIASILLPQAGAAEKVEPVLENLVNPCGVAVQPGTGRVFVSDSGAGRVLRVVDGKAQEVITGFPKDVYGQGPKYEIGPLGLTFLDEKTLVVGGGGLKDGQELVRVYTVPPLGETIDAGKMKAILGPLAAGGEVPGEGNFYAVAASKAALYVTCNGDDAKGWIARAPATGADAFGELKRFLATKEAVGVDAPVGLTISPRGYIVVGQMGEIGAAADSRLSFYNAKGKLLLNLPTGLCDIVALAYNPKNPERLYALDFAWADESKGGLYRLDAARRGTEQTVKAVKIVSLTRPAAMAFAENGTLYVAVFGAITGGATEKPGKLVKIGL